MSESGRAQASVQRRAGAPGGQADGITRKDFLDGAAVSAAGLAAAAAFPGLTGSQAMAKATADQGACRCRVLPADVHGPVHRPPGRGEPQDDQDRRPAAVPARQRALHQGRPRHQRAACDDTGEQYDCVIVGAGASGIAAAKYYLRPLRGEQAHPDRRRAAGLRRALAPQRVAHPQRGRRQRGRDDPAQRRHGEPRQHRHLEQGTGAGRDPRGLRPTGGRLPRLGGRRRRPPPRSGRTAAPRASRPRFGLPAAALPRRGVRAATT